MKLFGGVGALWQGGVHLVRRAVGNAPPVAGPDAGVVEPGGTIRVAVLGNDVDPEGEPLTLAAAEVESGGGSVAIELPDTLVYTAPFAAGLSVITYTVRDAHGTESRGRVTIEISEAEAPAAAPAWAGGDVVLIGASLFDRASRDAGTDPGAMARWAQVQATFAQVGFTGTLHNRSTGGARFADTVAALPGITGDYPAAGALYVVHRSGNDVTDTRPWDGSQQGLFDQGLAAIDAALPAAADRVNVTISRRLYTAAPVAPFSQPDVNGSRPYNENAVVPFILARQPDWVAAGRPVLDGYDWSDRMSVHLADGTHFSAYAEHLFAEWAVWRIAMARGLARPPAAAAVSGRSLLCSISGGVGFNAATGVNHVPGANYGLRLADGTAVPGLAVQLEFWGTIGAQSPADPTLRLADPRLGTAEMMNSYAYGKAPPEQAIARAAGTLRFMGLPPGVTGTATLAGARDSTGRSATVSHGGTTLELDNSNDAASNQVRLPFAADAGGEAAFALSVTPGHSHGYLSAAILDFD